MDHTRIEEEQIVERYVMGRLSTEETARFEEHYLTCDQCLDRLQVAERFQNALRGMAMEETSRAAGVGILAVLTRLAQWQRVLLAAGLLFAIALPSIQWARLAGEHQLSSGPQTISTLLPLSPVRSSPSQEEPAAQLTLTAKGERVAFSLDATAEVGGNPLRIALIDPKGTPLWTSPPITPSADGRLLISLPADLLVAGDHELRLEAPETGKRLSEAYRFRVLDETE